jgi:transposase
MIVPPTGVRVLVASRPVDFRKGMDGLAALARERLEQDPFSGTILVFRAKRADRVKLLFWDGSGLVLVSKRLEQGAFKWPPITDGVMRLSPAQLAALIEGTQECPYTRVRRIIFRGDCGGGSAPSPFWTQVQVLETVADRIGDRRLA